MRTIKKEIKKILNKIGSLYYRMRANHVIWLHLLNRKGKNLAQTFVPAISPAEEKIYRELREKGICIAHISDIFPNSVFDELTAYTEKRWHDPDVEKRYASRDTFKEGDRIKSKEYYLVNLWEGPHVLDIHHPLLRFSFSESIIRVIAAYLGTLPKFRYFVLEATVPMPEGSRAYASQHWHRDPDDQRLVKMFLYLNDVDETAGPFHYLKYSHEGGKWRGLFPQEPPRGNAKTFEDIGKYIPKEDVVTCIGKAGTLIFCDTSGLHKGGFASSNVRFMYTGAYLTHASPWPIRYSYPRDFNMQTLPSYVQYVVGNNPHQKEPRFY